MISRHNLFNVEDALLDDDDEVWPIRLFLEGDSQPDSASSETSASNLLCSLKLPALISVDVRCSPTSTLRAHFGYFTLYIAHT